MRAVALCLSAMKHLKKSKSSLVINQQTLRVLSALGNVRGGVIFHSENDVCGPSDFGTCASCPSHDINRCGTGQD